MVWYARNGYVHATPLEFALARPIDSSGGKLTEDPCFNEGLTNDADCWNIHVVVGDLRPLLDNLPYSLPFICFQRLSGFKIYPYKRIHEITETTESRKARSTCHRI